jgi:hypothetical protein
VNNRIDDAMCKASLGDVLHKEYNFKGKGFFFSMRMPDNSAAKTNIVDSLDDASRFYH